MSPNPHPLPGTWWAGGQQDLGPDCSLCSLHGWLTQARGGREVLVPFPGEKCRGLCRGLSGQQKSEEPAPGLAPQCPRVASEGYSPALGGGGAQPACAAGGLPGGTRPHLVISLQNHRCSITPSLMAKLGLAAAGRCGHCPSHPCPAPRLFWWVGLSSSAPHLPPMGLALRASLCEVPPCQAPAYLVASVPPLCSSRLLTAGPLPSPSMSGPQGSTLNTQPSALTSSLV